MRVYESHHSQLFLLYHKTYFLFKHTTIRLTVSRSRGKIYNSKPILSYMDCLVQAQLSNYLM